MLTASCCVRSNLKLDFDARANGIDAKLFEDTPSLNFSTNTASLARRPSSHLGYPISMSLSLVEFTDNATVPFGTNASHRMHSFRLDPIPTHKCVLLCMAIITQGAKRCISDRDTATLAGLNQRKQLSEGIGFGA